MCMISIEEKLASLSHLVLLLHLLQLLSVDHCPHLDLQLPYLMSGLFRFLVKALTGVLQLFHLLGMCHKRER